MLEKVKAIVVCLAACVLLAACVPAQKAELPTQSEVKQQSAPPRSASAPGGKLVPAKPGESCTGYLTGCQAWCKKNDPINDGCRNFCAKEAAGCRTTGRWSMDEGARVVVDLPPDPPPTAPAPTRTVRQAMPRENCEGFSTSCQEWCAKNKPGDKACANYCTEQLASCRATGQWSADNGMRIVVALPPDPPPTRFQQARPRETCTGYSTTCSQWCAKNRPGQNDCPNYCSEQLASCLTTGQWSMDNGERTVTGLLPR